MSGNEDSFRSDSDAFQSDEFSGEVGASFDVRKRRERRRQDIRDQVAQERGVPTSAVDVRGDTADDEFEVALNEQGQRILAARGFDKQITALDISPGDVDVSGETPELTTETRRDLAARNLNEQIDKVDVKPSDVVFTDDGAKLSGEAQRAVAVQQFDEQLPNVDIQPFHVTRYNGEFQLDLSGRTRVAAARLDEQYETDIYPGDLIFSPDNYDNFTLDDPGQGEFTFREDTRRSVAAETIDEQVQGVDITADDIRIDKQSDKTELTPDARKEIAISEFDESIDRNLTKNNLRVQGEQVGITAAGDGEFIGLPELAQREQAAEQLSDTLERDISPTADIVRTGERLRLAGSVQREEAAENLDEQVENADIGPGDVEETDDGFRLTDEVEQRLAAENLDEQIPGIDIGPADIRKTEQGYRLKQAVRRQQIAEQLGIPESALERGTIEQPDEGFRAGTGLGEPRFRVSDEFQRQEAAENLDEQVENADIGPGDIKETDDGFTLTDEVEQRLAAGNLDEQVENADIGPGDIKETDDGFTLTDEVEQRLAAENLDKQVENADIGPGDIKETDDGFTLTSEARENIRVASVADNIENADVADIEGVLVFESGSDRATLREQFDQLDPEERRRVEEQLQERDRVIQPVFSDEFEAEQRQRIVEQSEALKRPDNIDYLTFGSGGVTDIELSESGEARQRTAQKRRAAQAIGQELDGVDVTSRDVTAGGQLEQEFQRELAADRIDEQVAGIDVSPDDVTQADGQFRLADAPARELAAQQIDAEVDEIDVTPGDVTREDGSFVLGDDAQREFAATNLDQQVEGIDVSPEDVEQQGGQVRLSGDAQRRAAAARLDDQIVGVDVSADDVTIEDGQARLTSDAQDLIAESSAVSQFVGASGAVGPQLGTPDATGSPDGDTEGADRGIEIDEARQRDLDEIDPSEGPAAGAPDLEDIQTGGQQTAGETTAAGPAPTLGSGEIELFEAAQAAEDAVADVPGVQVSADVATDVGSAAGAAADTVGDVTSVVTDPITSGSADARDAVSGVAQGAVDAVPDPVSDAVDAVPGSNFVTGAGTEAGRLAADLTVGLPATAGSGVETGSQVYNFAAGEIASEGVVEGTGEVADVTGDVAGAAGRAAVREFKEDPAGALGRLTTNVVGGFAVGQVASPLRFSRIDVPEQRTRDVDIDTDRQAAAEGADAAGDATREVVEETTETTVRGARITTPPALEAVGVTARGRTVAGSVGLRPTVGSPSLASRIDDVDFTRLGATGTATVEPQGAFETDLIRRTTGDIGTEPARKFGSIEDVQEEATKANADVTVDSAEEAISNVRAVPEDSVGDVADALRDTDATVFGSAAARAQVDEFRQPRDLDIVVDEKNADTYARLYEGIEGDRPNTVTDDVEDRVEEVFDIKETEDVPGRARGGEEIKFGRRSLEPREIDGIPFNPAEEELIRKAGASGFLRDRGAAGTDRVDVGPEPRRAGRTDVREKDVEDTVALGEELLGENSALRDFERAFGRQPDTPTATGPAGVRQRLRLNELLGDDRAQLGARRPRRSRTDTDTDVDRQRTDTDTETETPRRRTDRDGKTTPRNRDRDSPGRAPRDQDTGSPALQPPDGDSPGTQPSPGDRRVSPDTSAGAGGETGVTSPGADFGESPTIGSPAGTSAGAGISSPAVDLDSPTGGSPAGGTGPGTRSPVISPDDDVSGISSPPVVTSPTTDTPTSSVGTPSPGTTPPATTSPPVQDSPTDAPGAPSAPSAPGTPTAPTGPSSPTGFSLLARSDTRRGRLPELDLDREEDSTTPLVAGERKGVFTDFRNPLSGAVLDTKRDDIDREVDQPVLVGFEDDDGL